MAKRPSYVSIRARQRNIIEGLGTTDLRYAEAAKRFGVTPRQLKTFVETKPRKLRSNYNRSPVYSKLYAEGERARVREELGIKRVRKFKYRPAELQQITTKLGYTPQEITRRRQIGEMILSLHLRTQRPRTEWAIWAREHNMPSSIKAIQLLHRNNRISDDDYLNAITMWNEIYEPGPSQYARYSSTLPEEYEVA